MYRRKSLWLVSSAGAAAMLWASPHLAFAADTSGAAPAGQVEEVVVTAQKRSQDLQTVPVSAEVVGGQRLAQQNYNSLDQLTQVTPDIHVGSSGGFSNDLYIRGIGSGENVSFEQSVATFVDDIYHGRSRMSGATFLDLDRIEILKGPQTTFFGANAIAGALNIVTRRPDTSDWTGWARALYGTFDSYAAEGAAGGPVADWLAIRGAVTVNGNGAGWIRNVADAKTAPINHNVAGRFTALLHPAEDFDAVLKVEGGKHTTNGSAGDLPTQRVTCPPPAPFPVSFLGVTGGGCGVALALGLPIGLDNRENTGLPGQGNSLSSFESVLTMTYRRWGQTFTSVTGFYNYHFNSRLDEGGLPIETISNFDPERFHQFSEEFRVASPTGGRLEYLAGVYVQSGHLVAPTEANAPGLNFVASVPGLGFLAPYLPLAVELGSEEKEQTVSEFGALTVNVTDRLKLDAGLRYSNVSKDFEGIAQYGTATATYGGLVAVPLPVQEVWAAITGLGPPGNQSLSYRDHAWMPSAGVQYHIGPGSMLYFTYNRGFKAGGFNSENPTFAPDLVEYGPEHVDAFEIGLKSKWFDNRLLLNLNLFRSDYQDLQVNADKLNPVTGTGVPTVANAAQSRSQGVEFAGEWAVNRDLRLTAAITYLESHYISYANAPRTPLETFCAASYLLPYCAAFTNPVPATADLSGRTTPYSPKWSGSLIATYSHSLTDDLAFGAQLTAFFTSSFNRDPELQPLGVRTGTGGYVRLDGRLTLSGSGGRWNLDLIGKNLTDQLIVDYGEGFNFAAREEPRNVAVQLRYDW